MIIPVLELLGLYGFTHLMASLFVTFAKEGELKTRVSKFGCDLKALPGMFK